MNLKNSLLAASCGLICAFAATTAIAADTVSITLPKDMVQFKPGPGAQGAQTYCVTCHTAEYVYMQPPLTRAQWEGVVNKMRKVFGAPLPEDQVKSVVDYLVTQNGKS